METSETRGCEIIECDIGMLEAKAEEDAEDPTTSYEGNIVGRAVCSRLGCNRQVDRIAGDGFQTDGECICLIDTSQADTLRAVD